MLRCVVSLHFFLQLSWLKIKMDSTKRSITTIFSMTSYYIHFYYLLMLQYACVTK